MKRRGSSSERAGSAWAGSISAHLAERRAFFEARGARVQPPARRDQASLGQAPDVEAGDGTPAKPQLGFAQAREARELRLVADDRHAFLVPHQIAQQLEQANHSPPSYARPRGDRAAAC